MPHSLLRLDTLAKETRLLVMLVDDDFQVREAGEKMLKRLGYRVSTFASPLAALDAFRQAPEIFDLVITDLTMPEMSGDELSRRLRRVRSDVPIIISSGYLTDDAMNSALVEDCLTISKPFTLLELRGMVESALYCDVIV